MSKVILTLDCMPTTCNECPLFVSHFGQKAYCVMHAEYSPEEIDRENNGNLQLYYSGCLSRRPEACPLKEELKSVAPKPKTASDISDLYPPTIFKRPCSNCENEDSINICDQCCFKYDSWFKKKEKPNDIG